MSNATSITVRLSLQELKALMFAMQAWATTVENLPLIPQGVERSVVRDMRRDVYALNERVQRLGEVYGLERP